MAYPPQRTTQQAPKPPSDGPTSIVMRLPSLDPVLEPEMPPPPENMYPCGCHYPGTHKPDCMWSLWEQMRDNYLQTKSLMNKFMSQVNTIQAQGEGRLKCQCPSGCHGQDLGEAIGLQQLQGVTVPWGQQPLTTPKTAQATGYPVQSEARAMIEEQRRVKNTWAQFLNVFDMALDLSNDVSKDRWEANRRRKERARLEREEMLEEQRQQRRERCLSAAEQTKETPQEKPKKKESRKEEQKQSTKPGGISSQRPSETSQGKSRTGSIEIEQENEKPEEEKPEDENRDAVGEGNAETPQEPGDQVEDLGDVNQEVAD